MLRAGYSSTALSLPAAVRRHVPLAAYTSFQIGGPADYFCDAQTQENFIEALVWARGGGVRAFVLGGGSNTLFPDDGVRGLVIRPQFKRITVYNNTITAEAGALLAQVVQTAVQHEFAGIAGWVGLPGTVGGAVRGNAGAHGVSVKDILVSATVFDLHDGIGGTIAEYSGPMLEFGYRDSLVKRRGGLFVLSATFHFDGVASGNEQRSVMREILAARQKSQPKGKNAGCIFKNPPGLSAGKLIDECGLKGRRVGGVEVSRVHGNFFQNVGGATQRDVLALIKLVKDTVYTRRRVKLHEEIEIVRG